LPIVALVGIILSIILYVVYFNANFNPGADPSFCSINAHIDCDAVARTAYARFLGVPFALWGLGFYTLILSILFFPFHKYKLFENFKHPKSYIFVLANFAVIVSVILFFISALVIGKVCMLCQALYLTNVILLIAAKMGTPFKELYKNAFTDMKNIFSDKKWIIITSVLLAASVIILALVNYFNVFVSDTPAAVINTKKQPAVEEIGNILGDKNAKLVINEYADYQCPYCAISHKMMLRLVKEVDGIRIDHHDFPLNSDCNPYVRNTLHPNSCTAIYYAKAAREQGKFWDLATLLYENKENLSEKNILKLAKSIGLDTKKLKKDAHNRKIYKEELKADVDRAHSLGIQGTPSFVIGIRKYEGVMPYEKLKKKILESM